MAGCGLNLVGSIGGDGGDAGPNGTLDGAPIPTTDANGNADVIPLEDAAPIDATAKKDVDIDAPPPIDAASPDGGCPTGQFFCPTSVTCAATCTGCKKAELGCPTTMTCIEECEDCPGNTFECWACGADRTTLAFAGCTPTTNTTAGCYVNGLTHCDNCAKDGCFGDNQVCVGLKMNKSECRGCGEQDTDKAACAGKGTCDANKLVCK